METRYMEMDFQTPIQYLGREGDADIYIKRDDLIPFSFGGNKVRIAYELVSSALKRGCDLVISYGSEGSNMNRAMAHMAKLYGLKCHVIIKKENDGAESLKAEPLNERLVRESGADITYCTGGNVRETVESVMDRARSLGEKPYYIYGNSLGTGNRTALMMAYFKAYGEILKWEREKGLSFEHIFLAVGTGCTISGLLAGIMTEACLSEKGHAPELKGLPSLHGISIARESGSVKDKIYENLEAFNPYIIREGLFDISDAYLKGGYGLADEGIYEEIRQALIDHRTAMDPTYSGKAFYGMKSEIKKQGYKGNCLFIHTGGTAGFFDRAGDIFA